MLGSFPPQKKRWCMDFYYPNFINDMWRIMGLLFYNNRKQFVDDSSKTFKKDDIINFAIQKGIALYDTATEIRRLKDNASDKYLEVVTPTDISALLDKLPECKAIVTTGQKATDVLCETFCIKQPNIGDYCTFHYRDKQMRLYRMPSSSRAYPMNLEKKTDFYHKMMEEVGLI